MKKLLLHICCANCGTIPIERLSKEFDLTLFWYNPNITSGTEHNKRLADVKKLVTIYKQVNMVEKEYDRKQWFSVVKGMEKEPEGGKRCDACIKLRMEKAAQHAKKYKFCCLATSLTAGPQKKAQKINSIGKSLAEKYNIDFYEADFKKKNGFKKSLELSRKYKFYRQRFCGCAFSQK